MTVKFSAEKIDYKKDYLGYQEHFNKGLVEAFWLNYSALGVDNLIFGMSVTFGFDF